MLGAGLEESNCWLMVWLRPRARGRYQGSLGRTSEARDDNWFWDSNGWQLVWIIHVLAHGLAFPHAVNCFGDSTCWQMLWGLTCWQLVWGFHLLALGLDNPLTVAWFGVSTCCQLVWGIHPLAIGLGKPPAGNWFRDENPFPGNWNHNH